MKKTKVFLLSFAIAALFVNPATVKKVLADSSGCNTGESCMAVTADSTSSTGFRNPTGLICTFRGVCVGNLACCAADPNTTAASYVSCYSNCVTGGATGPACQTQCASFLNADSTPIITPATTPATPATPAPTCPTCFSNPLNFSTVQDFLGTIMGALQKIIVSLALVMIVLGAVLYVTSGGGKQMETAKGMITAALVGLAIGIAAPSFLKEISIIIGWGGVTDATVIAAPTVSQIAINVLNFLLGILGILSLVMLIIGAFMYLTSAGDEGRIDTGKNIFKSALLGVIIAMASMIMLAQIAQFFVTAPTAVTGPAQAGTGVACTTPGQCASGVCTNGACI